MSTTIRNSHQWEDVFKSIAQVKLTADGTGFDVALHITKKDGMPVRFASDGNDPQAITAVRKINDTDFYCFITTTLAKKIGLSSPKTLALIRFLGLQNDPDCFKRIVIGRSPFKMYSGNALSRLKDALPDVDLEKVWRSHGPKPKKPRYRHDRARQTPAVPSAADAFWQVSRVPDRMALVCGCRPWIFETLRFLQFTKPLPIQHHWPNQE